MTATDLVFAAVAIPLIVAAAAGVTLLVVAIVKRAWEIRP